MKSLVKIFLIILACVMGCIVITVGGCVGCAAAIGTFTDQQQPHYATPEVLNEKYGEDFKRIQAALQNSISLKYQDKKVQLHPDILAVITEVDACDIDIYQKYDAKLNGYYLSNNAGTGNLTYNNQEIKCLIYNIEHNEQDYYICLKDIFAQSAEEDVTEPETSSSAQD